MSLPRVSVVLNSVAAGCLAFGDLKTYAKLRVRGHLINAVNFAFVEHSVDNSILGLR
jgi:hypothetical protein